MLALYRLSYPRSEDPETGLEPATSRLQVDNPLSFGPLFSVENGEQVDAQGTFRRLYHLGYLAVVENKKRDRTMGHCPSMQTPKSA